MPTGSSQFPMPPCSSFYMWDSGLPARVCGFVPIDAGSDAHRFSLTLYASNMLLALYLGFRV